MNREVEREITGRAENLQATLFGAESGGRPVLEHPNVPENTRAAIASATESMRVSGSSSASTNGSVTCSWEPPVRTWESPRGP